MINNLITVVMLLGVLLSLGITNIVLGAVNGSMNKKFSWKKLGEGILKVFLFCLCFLVFCFCLQAMPMILERVDIMIPDDAINLIEIIGLIVVAYKKYATDCYEKIKIILGV
ncbi:MAG: hypothetical protein K2G03_03215 [Bacilli bacterium]|nr:hypothetical protein [Bacilli bacterium]